MAAAEKLPWQELSMTAEECAELWSISPEHFLATVACKPSFPQRRNLRPATWRAGDVVDYLAANPACPRVRRRSSGSTT